MSQCYSYVNSPLIWDGTTAQSKAAGVWLIHKHKSQWALAVDIDDSWSTVGVGYAPRWNLSILAEGNSPMRFKKLSL